MCFKNSISEGERVIIEVWDFCLVLLCILSGGDKGFTLCKELGRWYLTGIRAVHDKERKHLVLSAAVRSVIIKK